MKAFDRKDIPPWNLVGTDTKGRTSRGSEQKAKREGRAHGIPVGVRVEYNQGGLFFGKSVAEPDKIQLCKAFFARRSLPVMSYL